MDLKKYIRSIPDYPKKGILFRDITTLIKDSNAFNHSIVLAEAVFVHILSELLFVVCQ